MVLKDVIECCGDKSTNFEIYRNSWSPENMIDVRFDDSLEFAFCEVRQIIPLQGDAEDPKPAFAVIVDPDTYHEADVMVPMHGSLKEYLEKLPEDVNRQIDGPFSGLSLVARFFIERDYPKIPLIRFEVADEVVDIIIPRA